MFVKSTTLIEVMVVAGIVAFFAAAILAFLTSADRSWHISQDKLSEQQEARKAIDDVANILRRSNAKWDDVHKVIISDSNKRIDFYTPSFYADCCPKCGSDITCSDECKDGAGNCHSRGEIRALSKVTYKPNPTKSSQLLKKEGVSPERVVANSINAISFNCGCSGCTEVNTDCPYVDISVTTQVQVPYQLTSKIALRNENVTMPANVSVVEPAEGEF